jgi:hypothetical protein
MLLALSNTRRTESIRNVFYLDSAQTVLAAILAYVLLYRMSLTPKATATVLAAIYITETALLAVAAVLRTCLKTYEGTRGGICAERFWS